MPITIEAIEQAVDHAKAKCPETGTDHHMFTGYVHFWDVLFYLNQNPEVRHQIDLSIDDYRTVSEMIRQNLAKFETAASFNNHLGPTNYERERYVYELRYGNANRKMRSMRGIWIIINNMRQAKMQNFIVRRKH